MDHAEFGPSSLKYFEMCPGWRKRPDSGGEAADRGHRIHDALERDEIDKLENEDERACAIACQGVIDHIRGDGAPDWDLREVRLDMDLGGELHTFGTADRLFIWGKSAKAKADLIDFKSGWRAITDADENRQGMAYVLGVFQIYAFVEEVTVWFLIPNRQQISRHTFARADIPHLRLTLNTIIRRAMESEERHPHPELCEYCRAQATCSALLGKALTIASKIGPDGLVLPEILDPLAIPNPDTANKVLKVIPAMEAWIEMYRAETLKKVTDEGWTLDDFVLAERSTPRSVTSAVDAYEVLEDMVSLDEFLSAVKGVSLPKLEEVVKKKAARGEKGKAAQALEDKLRDASALKDEGVIQFLRQKKS